MFFPSPDGPQRDRVGLRGDGPRAEGGAPVHPQHREADQEGRLQRAARAEVHLEVTIAFMFT